MQDDTQKDALLQEARELDRQLVDYVVDRLDGMALTQAMEQRIVDAVRAATSGQIGGLSDELAKLRNELAVTSGHMTEAAAAVTQASAAAASSAAVPVMVAAPAAAPEPQVFDPAPQPVDPVSVTHGHPMRAEGPSASKAEPAPLSARIKEGGWVWGLVAALVIGCAGAGYVAFTANARADSVCAKAQAVGDRLDRLVTGLTPLTRENEFKTALAASDPSAADPGAADGDDAPTELTIPQQMAREIENQRAALSNYSAALTTACSEAPAPAPMPAAS